MADKAQKVAPAAVAQQVGRRVFGAHAMAAAAVMAATADAVAAAAVAAAGERTACSCVDLFRISIEGS